MEACGRGHVEFAEVLLEHGAQLDGKDETGESALLKAAREGRAKVVELLLRKGAAPESRAVPMGRGQRPV